MSNLRRHLGGRLILAVAALGVVLAACGGDDSSSDHQSRATSTSVATQSTDPTTTAASTETAPPAPPINAPGCDVVGKPPHEGDTICVDGRVVYGPAQMSDDGQDVVLGPEPMQCKLSAGCRPKATGFFTGDPVQLRCEAPGTTYREEIYNYDTKVDGSDHFRGARHSNRWIRVRAIKGRFAGKEGLVSIIWLEPRTEQAVLKTC